MRSTNATLESSRQGSLYNIFVAYFFNFRQALAFLNSFSAWQVSEDTPAL